MTKIKRANSTQLRRLFITLQTSVFPRESRGDRAFYRRARDVGGVFHARVKYGRTDFHIPRYIHHFREEGGKRPLISPSLSALEETRGKKSRNKVSLREQRGSLCRQKVLLSNARKNRSPAVYKGGKRGD